MKRHFFLLLVFSLLLLFGACSEFNKIAKSTDHEYKYKMALEYYEKAEYSRASTLFQDLVHIYRGTTRGDDLYYHYAKSLFEMNDYVLAGHYFRSIVEQYPRSKYAEEAQFMIGYSFYRDSPNPRLDQSITLRAIDALRLFKNLHPYSTRVEEADILIDELQEKLAYKSYLNSKIYYDMGYYKAAVIALGNSLSDFQDTKYREEIRYMLFKSKYILAINSVQDLRRERLIDARDEFYYFVDEFPESRYVREVNRDFRQVSQLLGFDDNEDEDDLSLR